MFSILEYLIDCLEAQGHHLLGDAYYIPQNEDYLISKFTGIIPYDFSGSLLSQGKRKIRSKYLHGDLHRKDALDQCLFLSLTLFDKDLDNIEIIPFDPGNRSGNSDLSNRGFFLGQDRMFTKIMAWKHDHDFDFFEYRLTDGTLYALSDTLFNVKTDT